MIFIGNHLSSSNGYLAMGKAATALGGTTFAFLQEILVEEQQKK